MSLCVFVLINTVLVLWLELSLCCVLVVFGINCLPFMNNLSLTSLTSLFLLCLTRFASGYNNFLLCSISVG